MSDEAAAAYLKDVNDIRSRSNATEHTYRPALKTFVETMGKGIIATNEPKQEECGAPDFQITRKSIPLGHIEAKDVGTDLNKVEKSEQLKRYLEALPNLILTNYLEFRWYVAGEHRLTATLDVGSANSIDKVSQLLEGFIDAKVPTVRNPRDLAERMGGMARLMRTIISNVFQKETKEGTLHTQLRGFRAVLIETLSERDFADMYAQTICYGLFAARCNHDKAKTFTREQAAYELPKTNPFLREIFGHIAGPDLDERLTWIVDDLAELLDRADIERILEDFGKRTRRTDPVVHFYETFLAEYDPKLRETRGVYYTPEPVVSYIVRSVDHILKTEFKLPDGLADTELVKLPENAQKLSGRSQVPRVTILDPAVGTGTFLHQIIDHIREHLESQGQAGAWSSYVSQFLLPRLFGFELLMAPYAVCHLKLGLQLAETGYDFKANERLRVYLTNTLEEAHEMAGLPLFTQALAREAAEAGEAKQDYPVMVVLGNPPYSGHSANKGKWIHSLLRGKDLLTGEGTDSYFEVDGAPLGERNPKWLNDDYVKFIRFAQWRIERTGHGILAFITNHGYLDNPTFRGMRQSLMATFDDIYVLDLHGNMKKKERAPDGTRDENVFDIQQGVAIGIFIRRKDRRKRKTRVFHADLWGTRESWGGTAADQELTGGKYWWLWRNDVSTTKWTTVEPTTPFYLYRFQDNKIRQEYDAALSLQDIMSVTVLGFQTHRDKFAVAFEEAELVQALKEMRDPRVSDADFAAKYGLRDNRDWQLAQARATIAGDPKWREKLIECLYRPFDKRPCYFSEVAMDYPRRELLDHVFGKENLCLLAPRQIGTSNWQHSSVTCIPAESCLISTNTREQNYVFPVYLYPKSDRDDFFEEKATDAPGGRRPNLSDEYVQRLEKKTGINFIQDGVGDLKKTFGPEDAAAWIYAVLHSPTYRERYAEFLRIDFPRIPVTSKKALFRKLCGFGHELIALHLMETHGPLITGYPIEGGGHVERVRYTEPKNGTSGRVWINGEQYFEGVPPVIWEFHIGGYQVCQKWLKDRKGRKLEYKDIQHYQRVIAALAETQRLMRAIDQAAASAGGWPLK